MFFTCIYCSPGQNHDKFQNFCTKVDALLNNINDEFPICSVVIVILMLAIQGGGRMISVTQKI